MLLTCSATVRAFEQCLPEWSDIKESEEGKGNKMIIRWANKRIGKEYERKRE